MPTSNRELIHEWTERAWNKKDASAIDDCIAEDFIGRDPYSGNMVGRDGVREFFNQVHSGLSDFHMRVDDIVAEGDRACARYLCTAKHTGDFAEQAPTGKEIVFPVLICWHMRDGKLTKGTQQWGLFGVLNQLGANPFGNVPGVVFDPGPPPDCPPDVSAEEQERNKETIRRWMDDAWQRRDLSAVDRYVAEEIRFWDSSSPVIEGRDAFRAWAQDLLAGFSNFRIGVCDLIVEGDKTACRLAIQGDHSSNFHAFAPHGGKIDIESINIIRHEKGQMREGWQIFDLLTMLQQITQPQSASA